jgi:three-Cys-motif partner protein
MNIDESVLLQADGLAFPEVRSWSKDKHRKVAYYCSLFSKSMKHKWDCRVYIDLFSSAGKSKIRDTGEISHGSPLHALNLDVAFDRYVFCEAVDSSMAALRTRVATYFPDAECSFLHGDTNENVSAILSAVPTFNKDFKGLSLCFVDPYRKGELHFSTIEQIANNLYVDFLVLIPSFMDINRNEHNYTRADDPSLDIYLGTDAWREAWSSRSRTSQYFVLFI